MSIGVPVKLMHEAVGLTITVELKNCELYRGTLLSSEDNMNVQMANVMMTARDGRTSQLEEIFVRGSRIRFVVLPDMLKNAPMFKRVGKGAAAGLGRGRATQIRAQTRGPPNGGRGGGFQR